MSEATVRDLRNQGASVLARVTAGERVTITRDGHPVAELVPVPRPSLSADVLVDRFRRLAPVDPDRLREDVDAAVDQSL
ncbi:prevent-host-death family protein [Friedmanniella endophytica]|uniref:Antitoxin n=1 Tax=Microlunatus kandeliicorticis TaxID=1759536 RepID=A0A7W3IS02_9ACTN|nr:type II toxin-antitoxin system prevent-host-death family antitoxin [Microlunatus kandeliicorticis]MBA8794167.1 prevent-host-death family protein [Microlunatus kandeliicorticis]